MAIGLPPGKQNYLREPPVLSLEPIQEDSTKNYIFQTGVEGDERRQDTYLLSLAGILFI